MIFKIFFLSFVSALLNAQSHPVDIAFVKFGTYVDSTGQTKAYYIPRYFKSYWVHTRSICQAYGMDVLSLETAHEANSFLRLCHENAGHFQRWTHIGGMTLAGKSLSTWYWVNSGKHVDYYMKFGPGQPDNFGLDEHCLSIGKYGNGFFFNDIKCYGAWEEKFICQKTDSSSLNFGIHHQLGANSMSSGTNSLPEGSNLMPGGSNSLPGGSNLMPGGSNLMPGGSNLMPGYGDSAGSVVGHPGNFEEQRSYHKTDNRARSDFDSTNEHASSMPGNGNRVSNSQYFMFNVKTNLK